MKRIFLTGFAALFLFAAQAQTTKKSTKKAKRTHVTAESKAKAAMAQKEQERQDAIETQRQDLLRSDSLRRDNDKMADSSFAMQQTMWKDSMNKMQDSSYTDRYKNIAAMQQQSSKAVVDRMSIMKSAKLSSQQSIQAININDSYSLKAKVITDDAALSAEQKQTQLASLNLERMNKIKAFLGKGKAKRLEKARKDYVKKNGGDVEQAWIDTAEMATNKK